MFLHLLNDDQKQAFFDLASEMLSANGEVDDQEIHYMDRLIQEARLVKKRSLNDTELAKDLSVFNTDEAKHAAIVELLILSVIDGHYHVKESAFANQVIDDLGVDEETHEALCRITNDALKVLTGMRELSD